MASIATLLSSFLCNTKTTSVLHCSLPHSIGYLYIHISLIADFCFQNSVVISTSFFFSSTTLPFLLDVRDLDNRGCAFVFKFLFLIKTAWPRRTCKTKDARGGSRGSPMAQSVSVLLKRKDQRERRSPLPVFVFFLS